MFLAQQPIQEQGSKIFLKHIFFYQKVALVKKI